MSFFSRYFVNPKLSILNETRYFRYLTGMANMSWAQNDYHRELYEKH